MTQEEKNGLTILQRTLTEYQFKDMLKDRYGDKADEVMAEFTKHDDADETDGEYSDLTRFIPVTRKKEEPKYWGVGAVGYSKDAQDLMDAIDTFKDTYPELKLNNYDTILQSDNIHWDMTSMENADVSRLSARTVLALLVGAVRAEKFNDGAFAVFWNKGCLTKWLTRLQELDQESK